MIGTLPTIRSGMRCLLAGLGIFLCLSATLAIAADSGDSRGVVRTRDGQELLRYGASYALLIGVSDYKRHSGWKDLDSIPGELDRVAKALKSVGFQKVVRVDNPDDEQLHGAFEKFKDDYGFHESNRLLFFFAGHGYTDEDGAGYLVPADAPNPRKDRPGFFRKALAMSQILAWARQIKARHALFLFDSCFSGSVFRERSLPEEPPHITKLTARRVRQFITAGSANEPVPARSTFAPVFSDAVAHGKGDLNGDGYVTGMELGVHLEAEVPKYVSQTPQFGKIDEYDLAQGDFVFVLGSGEPRPKAVMAQKKVEKANPSASPDMELAFWNAIEQSKDPDDYRAYLGQFPNGVFAGLARNRIGKLAASKPSVGWGEPARANPNTGKPIRATPNTGEPANHSTGKPANHSTGVSEDGYVGVRPSPQPTKPEIITHAMTVRPEPADARIRILNIKPRYRPGIELAPGRYHVEVSRAGYQKARQWVKVREDMTLSIALQKLAIGKAGDKWTDPITGMEFMWVPGGCFRMGSGDSNWGDEKPVHRVCVKGFWLGRTEVTQRQWRAVMGTNPSLFKGGMGSGLSFFLFKLSCGKSATASDYTIREPVKSSGQMIRQGRWERPDPFCAFSTGKSSLSSIQHG
uniref:Sulfatase-modifying factor enzyme 1 n=1 Tax=Candidatus Kentrum sp. FW TaxID=2126338 RepID=A0A450TVI8_9GAMM|nr:MAG: Sulfatase-modifying factor enzyme 1 [Candidatus Kentron sp. FW]